jgi:hypothetical protein
MARQSCLAETDPRLSGPGGISEVRSTAVTLLWHQIPGVEKVTEPSLVAIRPQQICYPIADDHAAPGPVAPAGDGVIAEGELDQPDLAELLGQVTRCISEVRDCTTLARYRMTSRAALMSAGGMKLPRSSPHSSKCTSHSASARSSPN